MIRTIVRSLVASATAVLLGAGALAVLAIPALAQTSLNSTPPPPPGQSQNKNKFQPIPAGSTLRVRLDTLLSDKMNKSGDPFTGVVMEPIMVEGEEVIPKYSKVDGHVAFVKPSGRISGTAQLRVVVDKVTTEDNVVYPLTSTLQDSQGTDCNKTNAKAGKKPDEEGTINGCGKSKKDALKGAAIVGAMGASTGLMIGMIDRGGCNMYGCWPQTGPGVGADVGIGAGVGAGTALMYSLLKHEKHIVLAPGMELAFMVNRTTSGDQASPPPQEAQAQ